MYKLKKISEIKDIDEKVAVIGRVKDIGEKIKVEDDSGEILVSLRKNSNDVQLNINSKVLVFGTTKLTPKGIIILGNVVVVDDADEELLMEFEDIIQKLNKKNKIN